MPESTTSLITSLDSLPLSSSQVKQFASLIQNKNTSKESLRRFFSRMPNANSEALTDETINRYFTERDLSRDPQIPSSQKESNNRLGSFVTALGVGALASAADASRSEEIIWDLNEEKAAFEKDNLLPQIESAIEANDDTRAENLLAGLEEENLLSTQVAQLKVRAQEEGGDRKLLDLIDKKHAEVTKGLQKNKERDQKQTKQFLERLKKASPQNRKKMLEGHYFSQHLYNHKDLSKIISRGRFMKRSIFSKELRGNLLRKGGKERENRRLGPSRQEQQKTLEPLKKDFEEVSLPPRQEGSLETENFITQSSLPEYTDRETSAPIGLGLTQTFLSNPSSLIKELTIFARFPWLLPTIGAFLLVVLFVIVVVIIVSSGGSPDTSTVDAFITTIPCGVSLSDATRNLTSTGGTDSIFTQLMHDRFAITLKDGKSITDNPTDADNNLFQTICLLYGRDAAHYGLTEDKSVRGYLNSFGQLFLGLPYMTYEAGATSGTGKSGYTLLKFFDTGSTLCEDTYKLSGQQADISINQPSLCNSVNGGFMLRFKVAYNMGLALYDRVFDNPPYKSTLANHDSVDKVLVNKAGDFKKEYQDFFATASANLLPTYQCQGASKKDQAKKCLADLIGEYMSYQYYFDDGNSFPYSSNVTPPASSLTPTPVISPLSNFSNPANAYYSWYQFALDYLFDGVDTFGVSSSISSDYAVQLTKDVQTACAGPNNTGTIFGHYYVIVTADNAQKCLSTLSPRYDLTINNVKHSVTQQMISSAIDPNNGYKLQCIGFSQATSNGIDGDNNSIRNCTIFLPGYDTGQKWNVTCPANIPYDFISKNPNNSGKHNNFPILPGDYALFVWSGWGHIAYVVSSQPNDTDGTYGFVVSEANGGDGAVDISKTYQVDRFLIGVLRHK